MNTPKWRMVCAIVSLGLMQILVQAQGFNRHFDAFGEQFAQVSFGIEPSVTGWMVFSGTYEPDSLAPDSILSTYTIVLQQLNEQGDLLSEKKFKLLHQAVYLGWADCCDTVVGGGFITSGTRETPPIPIFNIELVRYDSMGDTLWTRSFGSLGHFWIGSQVKQTPDGGFIICGYTGSTTGFHYDGFALKTDSLGNEEWRHTYGTGALDEDYSCIALVPDGYVLSGTSAADQNNHDLFATRIDTAGNLMWQLTLGSPFMEASSNILYLQDGRILLAGGWGMGINYLEVPFVAFLNPATGDTLYTRTYGSAHYTTTIFASKQFPSSDMIHAGVSFSNGPEQGMLLRTNSDGDSLWMRNYYYYDEDVEQGQGRFFDVLPTADNGCIAAGVAYNPVNAPYPPGHSQDTWVVKVDSMGCVVPGCDGITGITELVTNLTTALQLYPNPVHGLLHVGITLPPKLATTGPLTLTVTSLGGQVVLQQAVPTSTAFPPLLGRGAGGEGGSGAGGEGVLDVSHLAAGTYALHLSDAHTWLAGAKFVVE